MRAGAPPSARHDSISVKKWDFFHGAAARTLDAVRPSNQNAIGVDQKLIRINRESIDVDQDSIDADQGLIDVNQESIDFNRKTIDFDQSLIDIDRKSIGVGHDLICIDRKRIDADQKLICRPPARASPLDAGKLMTTYDALRRAQT